MFGVAFEWECNKSLIEIMETRLLPMGHFLAETGVIKDGNPQENGGFVGIS